MLTAKERLLKALLEEALALLIDEPEPEAQSMALPRNVVPIKDDLEELTGTIGRPELKTPKGKRLFTAGLKQGDGSWVSIEAWGKTADAFASINRGDTVTVRGTMKNDSYLDGSGVMRHKSVFVVKQVDLATSAISA